MSTTESPEPATHQVIAVFVHESVDGDAKEDVEFGKLLEDIKLMHTFKNDVRMYIVVDDRALDLLALLEKPKPEPEEVKPDGD